MQTDIFTLCDSFAQADGKFNILGIAGGTYIIDPDTRSECSIVAIIRPEISDEDPAQFRFSLIHSDGDIVIARSFVVPAPQGGGDHAHIQVSSFPVSQFRYSGHYRLELYNGDTQSHSVPVIVMVPGVVWDHKADQ